MYDVRLMFFFCGSCSKGCLLNFRFHISPNSQSVLDVVCVDAKPFELQVGMPGRAEAHSTVINAKLTIALGEFGILEFLTLLKTI